MLLPLETMEEFCEKCSMSKSSSVGKNDRVSSLILTMPHSRPLVIPENSNK
jgi:hypothetical protein